jgi:hypothetical protein
MGLMDMLFQPAMKARAGSKPAPTLRDYFSNHSQDIITLFLALFEKSVMNRFSASTHRLAEPQPADKVLPCNKVLPEIPPAPLKL